MRNPVHVERMKFIFFLQDHYLVCSGDKYRLTDVDLAEIRHGIKVRPEWENTPMWKAIMAGDCWDFEL